jgi:hypothetical protein
VVTDELAAEEDIEVGGGNSMQVSEDVVEIPTEAGGPISIPVGEADDEVETSIDVGGINTMPDDVVEDI